MADPMAEMHEIAEKLQGYSEELLVPGRHLVRSGLLRKFTTRTSSKRMYFLFNDIVIYASVKGSHYKYKGSIELVTAWVNAAPPDGIETMFEIVCPNRLHPLIAETEAEKIGWVADLEAVIADLVTAHPEAKNERGTSGWKRKKFLGFTFKTKTSTLRASDFEEFKSMRDVALSNAGTSRDSGISRAQVSASLSAYGDEGNRSRAQSRAERRSRISRGFDDLLAEEGISLNNDGDEGINLNDLANIETPTSNPILDPAVRGERANSSARARASSRANRRSRGGSRARGPGIRFSWVGEMPPEDITDELVVINSKEDADKVNQTIERLQQELAEEAARARAMEKQFRDLQRQSMLVEADQLNKLLLENELITANEKLTEKEHRVAQLQRISEEANEEIARREARINDLSSEVGRKDREARTLENRLRDLSAKNEVDSEELAAARTLIATLETRSEEHSAEASKLRRQLEAKDYELTRMKKTLASRDAQLADNLSAMSAQNATTSEVVAEKNSLREALFAAEASIEALNKKIQKKDDAIERVNEHVESVTNDLRTEEARSADLREELAEAQRALAEATASTNASAASDERLVQLRLENERLEKRANDAESALRVAHQKLVYGDAIGDDGGPVPSGRTAKRQRALSLVNEMYSKHREDLEESRVTVDRLNDEIAELNAIIDDLEEDRRVGQVVNQEQSRMFEEAIKSNSALKAKVAELEQHESTIAQLRTEVDELQAELRIASATGDTARIATAASEGKYESALDEIAELSTQLAKARADASSHNARVRELTRADTEHETELRGLRAQVASLQASGGGSGTSGGGGGGGGATADAAAVTAELDQTKRALGEAEMEAAAANARAEALENSLERAQADIRRLESVETTAREAARAADNASIDARRERERLAKDLSQREADLAAVRARLEDAQAEGERLRAARVDLRAEMAEAERSADEQKAVIEAERDALSARIADLEAKAEAATARARELETGVGEARRRIATLEQDLANAEESRSALEVAAEQAQDALDALRSASHGSDATVDTLRAELAELSTANTVLVKERDQARIDLETLQTKGETMKRKLDRKKKATLLIAAEKNALDEEVHDLQKRVAKLEREQGGFIEEAAEAVRVADDLTAELSSANATLEESVAARQAAEARAEALSEDVRRLSESERALGDRVASLESELEEVKVKLRKARKLQRESLSIPDELQAEKRQVEARLRDESDKSDTLARQHARLLTELESLEGRNAQIQAALDEKTEAYTKLLMQYESTIFELDFLRAQEQGLGSEAGSWVDEPDATDFAVASNAEIADALCEMLEHACEVLAVEVESGAAMAPFLDVASAFRDSAVQATTLMETVLDTPVPEGDVSNDSEDSEHLDNLAQAADDILQAAQDIIVNTRESHKVRPTKGYYKKLLKAVTKILDASTAVVRDQDRLREINTLGDRLKDLYRGKSKLSF